MQPGIAHMLISSEDIDWRSELEHANRAFAAMIGGQLFENITREEAKSLGKSPLKHRDASQPLGAAALA
jgi:hypothetical protein